MSFCGECGSGNGCKHHPKDDCVFCFGQKGGVKGNENVYYGLGANAKELRFVVCYYCSVIVSAIRKKERENCDLERLEQK